MEEKLRPDRTSTLMRYVERIHRCYYTYRSNMLDVEGLSPQQHRYIVWICRYPGKPQDGLVREAYVNKSNVARQLSQLEQNGFIRREPCQEDRRQLLVYPTQKAMDVLPQVLEVRRRWNDSLLEGLTQEERERLMDVMERLCAQAQELAEESLKRGEEM